MDTDEEDPGAQGTVTDEQLRKLQEAHPHDPAKGVESTETLNKMTDPSLNDRVAPVGTGVSHD